MEKTISPFSEIETIQKMGTLLKNFDVMMMITLNESSRMHSRPMLMQKAEFNGRLWFFSNDTSQKITDLRWNRQVHLIGFDPKLSQYVAVCGTGSMIRDRERMKQLWKSEYQKWFPRGLFDPDLVLIEVQVDQVESWGPDHREFYQLPSLSAEPLAG